MSSNSTAPIAVIGAGSFGSALAIQLVRAGQSTILYDHNSERLQAIQKEGSNSFFLPGFDFPQALQLVDSLSEALKEARDILIVVPSHAFSDCVNEIKPFLKADSRIVWGTKGLDPKTNRLLQEVIQSSLGDELPIAAMSGPSFAREIAADLPTAVTFAGSNTEFCQDLARIFHSENFRPYTSDDLIGVQICGALKNPIAIAAGISDGLGYGANARAALITRALAEITRLGMAVGGQQETFFGLAGLGDLVLTCTDDQSRNRRFGLALGQGSSPDEALQSIGQVVEGKQNAISVKELADRNGVSVPIVEQVCKVINQEISPESAVQALLQRDLKSEFDMP